jgi:hypothetical protein
MRVKPRFWKPVTLDWHGLRVGGKTVGGLAKTKLKGQAKLTGQALMCFAAYNLVRMGSMGGWWDAHHA